MKNTYSGTRSLELSSDGLHFVVLMKIQGHYTPANFWEAADGEEEQEVYEVVDVTADDGKGIDVTHIYKRLPGFRDAIDGLIAANCQ